MTRTATAANLRQISWTIRTPNGETREEIEWHLSDCPTLIDHCSRCRCDHDITEGPAMIRRPTCALCAKTARLRADAAKFDRCPDGAECHHGCADRCWRVSACAPLSGVFPGDKWPARIVKAHAPEE